MAGAGMRGLKATALQGEAAGAPADEDPVTQRGADNAFDGIVLSGARRAGEVASEDVGMLSCQEEMLELAEVIWLSHPTPCMHACARACTHTRTEMQKHTCM